MSIESLSRSTVTHTLLVLGRPTAPIRLLFVDERSGETTTYMASRDDAGIGLTEHPLGRTVRLGYASGRVGRSRDTSTVTVQEVVEGTRYHLHRGEDVWGVDRLGATTLMLQACGTSDQAAVRGNDRATLGAADVFDVWISNAYSTEAAKSSLAAIAETVTTLFLSLDAV